VNYPGLEAIPPPRNDKGAPSADSPSVVVAAGTALPYPNADDVFAFNACSTKLPRSFNDVGAPVCSTAPRPCVR
jgi:hypothetical protein